MKAKAKAKATTKAKAIAKAKATAKAWLRCDLIARWGGAGAAGGGSSRGRCRIGNCEKGGPQARHCGVGYVGRGGWRGARFDKIW